MELFTISYSLLPITGLWILLSAAYLYRARHLSATKKEGYQYPQQASQAKHTSNLAISQKTATVSVFKESEFPDNWWTGEDVYELEKRAIFSQNWIYICHRSRFTKPGDYHSFELASFPLFLTLGKDNIVRAFHNVCRHRAYQITKKESGSSLVLGCRYHGWSYNTCGDLVRAPHFDDVPGFEKSQNGLFEIHTAMTRDGLIFINLDANPTVPAPDFNPADEFMSKNGLGIHSTWISGCTIDGDVNWKAAGLSLKSHNFNLQVHESNSERPWLAYMFQKPPTSLSATRDSELSMFPNSTIYGIDDTKLWYSLCLLPCTEARTRVRCDIFSCSSKAETSAMALSERLFDALRERMKAIEKEFVSFSKIPRQSLHDYKDLNKDHTDAQYEILLHLKTHRKREKTVGEEVYPTMRRSKTNHKYAQANLLCSELDCLSKKAGVSEEGSALKAKDVLVW